jgi:hypothetical protein
LEERPTLRWHALTGAKVYTVRLVSDDGQQRPAVTVPSSSLAAGEIELPYPVSWPSLEAGGPSYQLVVDGGGRCSDEGGTFGQGFSLLAPAQAGRIRSQVERLGRRLASEPARTLLLAELYLSYGLRCEAAAMLATLPDGGQVGAIQQVLGQTYLDMGLFGEAETAFGRALVGAAGLPEAQAAAHYGLGLAACGRWDDAAARAQWRQAETLYQELSMAAREQEVAGWLADASARCSHR